jgi:multiple antibiotic resistance protein
MVWLGDWSGKPGAVMEFSFVSILLILFVVGGATKAAAYFAAAAGGMSVAERRSTVFRAVGIQAVVMYAFAFRGQNILHFFHVSLGALEIAGGLILLIFAIGLVLGEDHGHDEGAPKGDIAIYPLAVPLMASPQAIVGTVIIFAKAPDMAAKINGYIAIGVLLAVNLLILLAVGKLVNRGDGSAQKSSGAGGVLLRIVAILLSALAVELIVMGLREYGIIAAATTVAAH